MVCFLFIHLPYSKVQGFSSSWLTVSTLDPPVILLLLISLMTLYASLLNLPTKIRLYWKLRIISSHCYWTTGETPTTSYPEGRSDYTGISGNVVVWGCTITMGGTQELSSSSWPWANTGNPVLEAEKSHLGLETGASGRRAASRTGWGGPWKASSCLWCSETTREIKEGR